MIIQGYRGISGAGQSGFDTVEAGTPNAGAGFTGYSAVGGPNPNQAMNNASPLISQTNARLNNRVGHTAENMSARMTSNTANVQVSCYLMVNGAQGAQILNILAQAYATGAAVQDVSHQDVVPGYVQPGQYSALGGAPSAPTLGYAVSWPGPGASGECIFNAVHWQIDCPNGVAIPFASNPNASGGALGSIGTYARRWVGVSGGQHMNSGTVAQAQCPMPVAGTWGGIQLNMATQATSSSDTYNRTFQACVEAVFDTTTTSSTGTQGSATGYLSVGGRAAVGVYEDSYVDAAPNGSLINYQITEATSAGGGFSFGALGSTWWSAQPNVSPMTSVGQPSPALASGQLYAQIVATDVRPTTNPSTAEALSVAPCSGGFENLSVSMTQVAATSTPASQLYINGALDGSSSASNGQIYVDLSKLTAPGVMQDLSHTDVILATWQWSAAHVNVAGWILAAQSVGFRTPEGGGGLGLGL